MMPWRSSPRATTPSKIFQHPFLYLAADTSDVMAATDPRRVENFRWHNMRADQHADKPRASTRSSSCTARCCRRTSCWKRCRSFWSACPSARPRRTSRSGRPSPSSRATTRAAWCGRWPTTSLAHFAATGDIGRKYLIDHSAGSGKTLSICWLADRLHSLFKPGTNEKLVDIVFILTDRKSLDTNIREDIEKFTHLKDVVGLARKADDLPRFLKERKPIIVTTQQKFAWVLEEIEKNPELKKLRVAFLIDEAHRSQEGQMGVAIRVPFRKADEPDAEDAEDDGQDDEEKIAKIIREHDLNQLFVAFTATPAPATVTLFGAPFDTYTEAEAIAEGYIVDVAASIISYKTLYNLHCPIVPEAGRGEALSRRASCPRRCRTWPFRTTA